MRCTAACISTAAVSAALLVALFAQPGCADKTTSPRKTSPGTLETLTKVDPYPLYVMRYHEDYHFDERLKSGAPTGREGRAAIESPWACTTFAAFNGASAPVLGRNFDWHNHAALLLCTDPPDGYASVSMVDPTYLNYVPDDQSSSNLNRLLRAPFYPFDGLNERGVAIGMMAVPHAEGGRDPGKVTIGSLDAVRLVLDYAATVDEAAELLGRYNIDFTGGPPVHYLVSDAANRSAVIEFVADTMRVLPNDTVWQVATNFTITGYVFNGSPSGCWRYNQATGVLAGANGAMTWDAAMNLLQSVAQSSTMWSIVYGAAGDIHVAAGRAFGNVHAFTLKTLRDM